MFLVAAATLATALAVTTTFVTPLPSALALFATGMAGLGPLGWPKNDGKAQDN